MKLINPGMSSQPEPDLPADSLPVQPRSSRFLLTATWFTSICLVLIAGYLGWQTRASLAASPVESAAVAPALPLITPSGDSSEPAQLPAYSANHVLAAIQRRSSLHTIIPNRPRQDVMNYTVETGDSVFGIAQKFSIMPETILWSNYDVLNDNPDELSPGMQLNIPPVDGVYYQWEEGDTLEGIASYFKADKEEILNWPGNHMDLTNPTIEPGTYVLIPGGEREFRQWLVPTIAREGSGVSKDVLGAGACEGSYSGAYGSGAFAWPTASHYLSGNDYWSGHLGIDIAGGIGDGIFAADSGVVVFSGWALYGYGYMIMIDHGNGYQTLYAHLSAVSTTCGQSVYQGNYIGAVGSTGNSTGPHLHFEVRYLGGFINPWFVLPAP
ncbi:MAG: peptidoglycan DD-metalloendopeptidase family protein [Anaerolineales bacterium]|nr:peptidoglycan DD-metalloendopeptidase family protein [Anaerolineales bacterium]